MDSSFITRQTLYLTVLFIFVLTPMSTHAGPAAEASADPTRKTIQNGKHRAPQNTARDVYRHPWKTLDFFEVGADMTVVEIWPGGGWYSEFLAPLTRDHGTLYAAHFSSESSVPYFRQSLEKYRQKLAQHPQVYDRVRLTTLQPPEQLEIAPEGSADRVLTFRNVHNWIASGQADAVFGAMFKALKPGGILGVVEHRGAPDSPQDPAAKSGYVTEETVIGLASRAGFVFERSSEINANPRDTRNHPNGVWTLPPSLRLEDQDRDKYLGIGESDRMTLKFRKPAD